MKKSYKKMGRVMAILICMATLTPIYSEGATPERICDIEAAEKICADRLLDPVEGIWIYPADEVTVLIRKITPVASSLLPSYQIMAIETADCRIAPGDVIGSLEASPDKNKFILTLFGEKKKGMFSHPRECLATLSKEEDTMILSKEKSRFRIRINLNPNSLLPALWKSLLRFGVSVGTEGNTSLPAPGMIKIYPSYDGNGSSRRQPRYL